MKRACEWAGLLMAGGTFVLGLYIVTHGLIGVMYRIL